MATSPWFDFASARSHCGSSACVFLNHGNAGRSCLRVIKHLYGYDHIQGEV